LFPHNPLQVIARSFFTKKTPASLISDNRESDGSLPLEQAACLLAMHCMVRGQSPEDYVVMVEAEQSHTLGLVEKSQQATRGRAVRKK